MCVTAYRYATGALSFVSASGIHPCVYVHGLLYTVQRRGTGNTAPCALARPTYAAKFAIVPRVRSTSIASTDHCAIWAPAFIRILRFPFDRAQNRAWSSSSRNLTQATHPHSRQSALSISQEPPHVAHSSWHIQPPLHGPAPLPNAMGLTSPPSVPALQCARMLMHMPTLLADATACEAWACRVPPAPLRHTCALASAWWRPCLVKAVRGPWIPSGLQQPSSSLAGEAE